MKENQTNTAKNGGLYSFAIDTPQNFSTAWQRVENAINGNFDNARFLGYQQKVKKYAISLFYSGKYTPLSIHAWQVKLLDRALKICRNNDYLTIADERKIEQQKKFAKIDAIAKRLQTV